MELSSTGLIVFVVIAVILIGITVWNLAGSRFKISSGREEVAVAVSKKVFKRNFPNATKTRGVVIQEKREYWVVEISSDMNGTPQLTYYTVDKRSLEVNLLEKASQLTQRLS